MLSLNIWSDYTLFGYNFMGSMEYLTNNIMLPLGGFFIAVFSAWTLPKATSLDELHMGEHFGYRLWRFLARYVAPVAVIVILLNATGLMTLMFSGE